MSQYVRKIQFATPVGTGIWIGNAWDAPDGTSRTYFTEGQV